MFGFWTRQRTPGLLPAIVLVGLLCLPVGADPPAKKRVKRAEPPAKKRVKHAEPPSKKRVKVEPASPKKSRVVPVDKHRRHRVRPIRSYVRTRRDFGHVRVIRRDRRADGRLHVRPILVRSAWVRPVVIERFEDRRRDQLRLIVQHFRAGQRARAIEVWRTFVNGLVEYHEPIDLDEVMLYIAREGCAYENDAFAFHASKLEFMRESRERLEDYVDLLYEQREACERGTRPCSPTTLRNIEAELARMRADLEVLEIEEHAANDALERIVESSSDYENRFAAVFDDMYREVEVRITVSP